MNAAAFAALLGVGRLLSRCTKTTGPEFRQFSTCCKETDPVTISRQTLSSLEDVLCHKFSDRSLLAQAMVHRSLINTGQNVKRVVYEEGDETIEVTNNNERLELLGDRVFGLLTTHLLFKRDWKFSEGEMSHLTHRIVSRKNAHHYCEALNLHDFLLQSDELRGQRGSRYGDFFEALLGAVFLDGGYTAVQTFFDSKVAPLIDFEYEGPTCWKMALQELLMSHGLPFDALGTQLKYVRVSADFTTPFFIQAIELFGKRVSIGRAPSRAAADQQAAQRLLTTLRNAETTCFLIRLARNANEESSLAKLLAKRQETNAPTDCSSNS